MNGSMDGSCISVPPTFTMEPEDAVVFKGDHVTFDCAATGSPAIDAYEWSVYKQECSRH